MSQETRPDPKRFTILKNIKAYRDANSISADDDSTFADSGYTSGHFSSYSQEHVSGKHFSSATLDPIEEEQQSSIDNIMATPSATAPLASTSTVITPNTANMQKIMNLHITTPTEITSPEKPEFLEPKTPQKSVNDSRALNTTPRKAKLSRKRSFVEDNVENTDNVKRTRTTKSKDDGEILALRIPFSPISKPNQRILRERSVSDNNLLHHSSTPKSVLRRRIFAVSGETTPEKRTLRRFQSFSPNAGQKRKGLPLAHPYKRSMAFDRAGSSKEAPNAHETLLNNIPETEEEPDDARRDVRANLSVSFSIGDASAFIETSFNVSPIIKSGFDKLFEAPIQQQPPIAAFQLEKKTEGTSMLNKSMDVSPSKVDTNLSFLHDLPRTPPKETPTKLKRSRTTPLKKNLLQKRSVFFDGLEKMDIISRLQGAPGLIDQIFQHLTDEDVLSSCMVSYRWKSIIEESKVLNKRRVSFVTNKRPNKENAREKVQTTRTLRSRQPFAVHNYDTRSSTKFVVENSPPVSPGKAKFRENQKIIRKLSPRAMTTCIRCGKPSPIITQKARDQVIKIGRSTRSSSAKKSTYNLRKTVSDTSAIKRPFDDSMMFHFDSSGSDSSGSEKKIRRALFNDNRKQRASVETNPSPSSSSSLSPSLSADCSLTEYEEYGSCSGKLCGFKFCVKCLTEYHPGQPCRSPIEMFSPNRLEELATNRGNLMCSRQSRRTLKRLCS